MKAPDIIIAIDPDIDGSGVATLELDAKVITATNMRLPILVDYLKSAKEKADIAGSSYVVVVEASWLCSGNWHLDWDDSRNRAAAKGRQVGRNHEIGRQIVEFCNYLDITYEEKYPLRKTWAGKDGKITAAELQQLCQYTEVTLLARRTNQEMRDAMLIALDRSNLPLTMKFPPEKRR